MTNKLEVWKLAHEFTLDVYGIADPLPRNEMFGLISQMKRSAASVPTNIIEGQARQHKKEFMWFLNIAKASNAETRYHLYLSKKLGYISNEVYSGCALKSDRIAMMLNKLIASLK